jgi:hypothetical protein
MNTWPWSQTMHSGTMTGLAAAWARRSSSDSRCWCGSTERVMARACDQPGRIGSGMTVRASSRLASTDLVVGRSTTAVTVRVATSIIPVISTRPGRPLSSRTAISNGLESICISSPGRTAVNTPYGVSGFAAIERRVRAEPVMCRPWANRSNSR